MENMLKQILKLSQKSLSINSVVGKNKELNQVLELFLEGFCRQKVSLSNDVLPRVLPFSDDSY